MISVERQERFFRSVTGRRHPVRSEAYPGHNRDERQFFKYVRIPEIFGPAYKSFFALLNNIFSVSHDVLPFPGI
jgi:hypothetical protein